jgi:hypothetical protein
MYAFQPRFPLDHALALYRALSSGEYERGDILMLVGSITGEVGALLKSNSIALSGDVAAMAAVMDYDACLEKLGQLEASAAALSAEEEPTFDITPFIPIILKLIELWLSRRGS